MKTQYGIGILLLTASLTACESVTAPGTPEAEALTLMAANASHLDASGTFTQTSITSLDVSQVGPNTILDQTSAGLLSGTMTGTYTDELKVVIHPNGGFNAHFTIRCECTIAGEQGTLDLIASDRGELVSPTLASFRGSAVINGGTGDLSDLRGVLEIEGTIDLVTGLATYTYSGRIH